jgi:DHA1 family inner membrane transport protein
MHEMNTKSSSTTRASCLRVTLWPDRRTLVVGFGITLGNVAQSAVPWIVGGLHESAGLSLQDASLMTTAEMLTMGVVMLVMSTVVHRVPQKAVLVGAIIVCVVGQGMTMMAHAFWGFALARALSGLGFGVIYSLASAIGAGAVTPERTFGTAGTITLLLGTLINPLLGFGLQHHGYRGVFGGMILLALVMAGPLCFISFKSFERPAPLSGGAEQARFSIQSAPIDALAAVCIMLTMALMASALTGIFVFIEQIARRVGIEGTALGGGMSLVSLIGASGGVLANAIGKRVGSTVPLLVGLPLMGFVILGMTVVDSLAEFWVIFTVLVVLFWFLYPFIFGLASIVDPKGRIASGTASAKILFSAGGTALAGYMATRFGLLSYGIVAVGLCVVSAALVFAVITNLKKTAVRPLCPAGAALVETAVE